MAEARRADPAPAGRRRITLRIGIQNDLAAGHIGDWVAGLPPRPARNRLLHRARLFRPDVRRPRHRACSTSRCCTRPAPLPDLHFTSVGDVTYRLISSDATAAREPHARPLHPRQLLPRLRDRAPRAAARTRRSRRSPPARTPPSRACSPPWAARPIVLDDTAHGARRRRASARSPSAPDRPAGLCRHPPAPPHQRRCTAAC